jgi:histidine triad (HIT) family protein
MDIFSKIAAGEIPSYKIAEDDNYYAFLDINPLNEGHTLVIPRRETDYIFDLTPDELAGLTVFAQRVAKAIDRAIECKRVAMVVIGLEVPHVHIHLIPIQTESDVDFRRAKLKPGADEFEAVAAKIRQHL